MSHLNFKHKVFVFLCICCNTIFSSSDICIAQIRFTSLQGKEYRFKQHITT